MEKMILPFLQSVFSVQEYAGIEMLSLTSKIDSQGDQLVDTNLSLWLWQMINLFVIFPTNKPNNEHV